MPRSRADLVRIFSALGAPFSYPRILLTTLTTSLGTFGRPTRSSSP
jgi:hypothetical protein